jgi:hypothetical protein
MGPRHICRSVVIRQHATRARTRVQIVAELTLRWEMRSRSAGVRDRYGVGQHDAVRGAAVRVAVGHDEERAAVVVTEHAREATAVGMDGVQHLAAFGDA